MDKNVVVLDLDRYNELINAEIKLELIKLMALKGGNTYGYGSEISNSIDTILGIERE